MSLLFSPESVSEFLAQKLKGANKVNEVNEQPEQKRIFPEQLLAIFRETNLTPTQGKMFDSEVEATCACGIGAYLYKQKGMNALSDAWGVAYEEFGEEYVWQYVHGFDNVQGTALTGTQGFNDGEACRKVLVENGYKLRNGEAK